MDTLHIDDYGSIHFSDDSAAPADSAAFDDEDIGDVEYHAHWCPYRDDLSFVPAEECEDCDNGVPK
jgi:hypothetical protein